MKGMIGMQTRWKMIGAVLAGLVLVGSGGCDTGFGQPCDLPQTPQIRAACEEAPAEDGEQNDNDIVTESKPSCALKNFAGCETRICLVYRGSSPFCSTECRNDGDCEGGAVCRPILGDADAAGGDPCAPDGSGFTPECYCVRGGDSER
jgi:hypothetical protein